MTKFEENYFGTNDKNAHKSWCFTWNNYSEKVVQFLKDKECNYIVFGYEIAETGTPHLQGCITFKSPCRFSNLKKNGFDKANLGPARNIEAARNYCMKQMDYFIKDNRKQGERNDINDAIKHLKQGGMLQVLENSPKEFIKYHSGLQKAAFLLMPKRQEKPTVHWRWGKTGVGKTRYVWENHDVDDVYEKDETSWWDGYEQQPVVLIDDFRGNFQLAYLLRLLDRYPMKVQVKGGYVQFNSPTIYITSCKPPEEIYHNCNENIDQLLRRVTVTEVTNGNTNISNTVTGIEPNYDDYNY